MRILITQESDWLERNPLQHHHLAELLSLRGHDVRVIDHELLWRTQGKRELRSRRQVFTMVSKVYDGAGVSVIRPGILKIPWLDYFSLIISHREEIARQIGEFKPDIIVGFGILNTYLAARAARKNSIAFVYHWLDVLHWLIPFRPFQPLGRAVESRTLRQADRVVVVSEKLRDFVAALGAPPQRTTIVKSGVSLQLFSPAISGRAIREQYGLAKDDIVVFFMGWLYQFSGLKEVALELAARGPERVRLLIVGEGDAYADLQDIQRRYGLEDRVILAGKKPYSEIPGLIAAADICLLPSYPWQRIMQDGLPAKLYEYMAMQKPVLSTRLPGVMREFGEDNGVIYVNRPEDVVGKAAELVRTGEVCEAGRRARTFVEKHGWDNIADQYEQVLTEVIEQKRSRKT